MRFRGFAPLKCTKSQRDSIFSVRSIHIFIDFACLLSSSSTESNLLGVDIESFWTEGYAGQIPNNGHELAIYVL